MDIGDILFLRATKLTPGGAFLRSDKGKEIFMPKTERLGRISLSEEYLVMICFDEISKTTFATEKINNYIIETVEKGVFEENEELEGIIYEFSPLGAKVALRKKYLGLIYINEVFKELNTGDTVKVFIKKIREDGKIDLTLQRIGYRNFINDTTEIIIQKLKASGGFLPLSDKSTPDAIYKTLGISKKRFKESIGALYREQQIDITDKGIKLISHLSV